MVFLRSEEHLARWLDARGFEAGATLTSVQMNELAQGWWWSRLDPCWTPRTAEESQSLLDGLGLTGEFWALR